MSKVYMSFLGLGSDRKISGLFEYDKAVYELNRQRSSKTEFVQVAELEILGASRFDEVIIVSTQKSYDAHFENLKKQLTLIGVDNPSNIIISEDMSSVGQWAWFEQILYRIEFGDELTIDLTHGYRSIPIVFSAAINFLQKGRGITVDAVYYGAYDSNRKLSPIVDMKEFYLINEWADGVSRLVEDADVRKIALTAERAPQFQAGELNDEEVIRAFEELTNAIRNVDVNNVAEKANRTIALLREKEKNASVTGRILLKLVMDKFASLMIKAPPSGKYDKPYFRMQLELIRLLIEHKLFMQAYTVMREFIASLGLIGVEKSAITTHEGRRRRLRFGEAFVCMMQFEENKWKFNGRAKEDVETLRPYYEDLKTFGVEPLLRSFTGDLADYRNGFDHAWTLRTAAKSNIEEKGKIFYNKLEEVIQKLSNSSLL